MSIVQSYNNGSDRDLLLMELLDVMFFSSLKRLARIYSMYDDELYSIS